MDNKVEKLTMIDNNDHFKIEVSVYDAEFETPVYRITYRLFESRLFPEEATLSLSQDELDELVESISAAKNWIKEKQKAPYSPF